MLQKIVKRLIVGLEKKIISSRFNQEYYLKKNPDVRAAGKNAIGHYIKYGDEDRRSPIPGFNIVQYERDYPNRFYLTTFSHAVLFNKEQVDELITNQFEYLKMEGAADLHREVIGKIDFSISNKDQDRDIIDKYFDPLFYSRNYPDVNGSDVLPVVHYKNYGWKEGRKPCDWFDPAYYIEHNPDLPSEIDLFAHYIQHGKKTGILERNIFSQRSFLKYYLNNYNFFDNLIYKKSLRENGINVKPTIDHFIDVGSRLGLKTSNHFDCSVFETLGPSAIEGFIKNRLNYNRNRMGHSCAEKIYQEEHFSEKIYDVIVPIYDGFKQTKDMIKSLLKAKNNTKFNIILIYDQGPDNEILKFIKSIERSYTKRVKLYVNEANMGFVKTINRGFFEFTDQANDTIILNSDIILSDHWLDRMLWHVDYNAHVGTVTPFSNNATICNFPSLDGFSSSNCDGLVEEFSQSLHDENAGLSVQIPTGVGFCMYVSRKLLDTVGGFNEDMFDIGYGEENDLCRRGEKAGFVNLQALDCFVLHEGGVSFSSRNVDLEKNTENLITLHPEYNKVVQDAYGFDWAKNYRIRGLKNWLKSTDGEIICHISHGLGGGTRKFIDVNIEDDELNLILTPKDNSFSVDVIYKGFRSNLLLSREDFLGFISGLDCKRTVLHHLLGWDKNVLSTILNKSNLYDVVIHDFHWWCARLYGVKPNGKNCGLSYDTNDCIECVNSNIRESWAIDADLMRNESRHILNNAGKVICSTKSVQKRIKERFTLKNTVVRRAMWDSVYKVTNSNRIIHKKKITKGVILGSISKHKGSDVVRTLLPLLKKENVSLYHIGGLDGDSIDGLTSSGEYKNSELKNLIEEQNPDFLWLPSVAEETYSFTFSEAVATPYPLFVHNVGTFPERALEHDAVMVLDLNTSPKEIVGEIIGKFS